MLDPDISTAGALHHLSRSVDHPGVDPEADGISRPGDLSRRHFLQLVGMGMGAGLVAGPGTSLLDHVIPGHDPSVWAAGPVGPNDGILLVVGLYGGNDGLNTVVQVGDGHYYDQHGSLAIPRSETQEINGSTGLHEDLTVFKRFWEADQLAIVEGVGHTDMQDFSHFSSMAKWMAGYSTPRTPDSGWVGRWLDEYLGGSKDLYAAAEIGRSLPLHMIGRSSTATVVPTGPPDFGVAREWRASADNSLFQTIRDVSAGTGGWHARVGGAQVDQLDVAATLNTVLRDEQQGEAEIVSKLEVAARLINANLGFRVITAGFGDFDSHAGQPSQHDARMQELDAALQRFFGLLHPDWGNRVTVMTFSEFGRTSYDNDGLGTDHGSSAPQFVLGSKVKGGFYGQRPSLAGLRRWDRMPTHVSHADYFGSVLDGWMGGAGSALPDYGSNLGLFRGGPDGSSSVPGQLFGQYVAMNPVRIFDSRDDTGGPTHRIQPGETIKVRVAGANGVPAKDVRAVAVNITSIRPSETTYLTGFPSGYAQPFTATVNPTVGKIIPNMSVVGVGSDGTFSLYNNAGGVDVTVDMAGYFRKDTAAQMTPLTPARLLDTRNGTGFAQRRLRAGEKLQLRVTGVGGVPASGVQAVILNLTSIRPSQNGWITAYPNGGQKPFVASLSYRVNEIVPNMAICTVGDGGIVTLEASHGDVHMTADVVGCFTDGGSRVAAIPPSRLLDTREGLGAAEARLGAGREINLQVGGRGGVPSTATAAVLNITGIRADVQTFLTVYPDGESRPLAASLNPQPGAINGNLVVAKLGNGGRTRIYNDVGTIHLTADVTGYFI